MKQIQLSTGLILDVHTADEVNNITDGYDLNSAQMQIANCGYFFTNPEYGDVIDNEFDLADAYSIVREKTF